MKNFNTYFPVNLIFGAGTLKQLGGVCARYGKKAFVVFDPFLKDSKLAKDVLSDLESSGLQNVEFYDVVPNPRHTTIDAGAALCKQKKCDIVLAIGGGSAMDTGKAIALVAVHGGSCWDYTVRSGEQYRQPSEPCLPVICVPTTAGTGSEATHISVVNNTQQKLKAAIINAIIYPKVSIIDPETMLSVPPAITALTGLDTFAHAFESYIAKGANDWSEMLALRSIALFASSIRTAVNQPGDIEARSRMALSCALAGYAFTQSGLCLPHSIGQPVSALTDAPHGGTLAVCIPEVIKYTIPFAQDKFARVAEILKPCVGFSEEMKAKKLPEILGRLYEDIHVDVSYGGYGLKKSDVDTVVDLCFSNYVQDLQNHPKPTGRDEVRQIVEACL